MAANPQIDQTERILLDAGLIDSLQLTAARKRMRRTGGTLPGALVRMGLVPESRVLHLLSRGYSLGVADRDRLRAPQAAALERLEFEDAWNSRVLPLRLEERGGQVLLEVAASDPEIVDTLAARGEFQGVEFLRLVAGERELERAIEAAYDQKASPFRPVALDSANMRESIGQELYPLRENPPAKPEAAAPPAPEQAADELEIETSEAGAEDLPEVELEVEPTDTWQEVPAPDARLGGDGESAPQTGDAEDVEPSFETVGIVEGLGAEQAGATQEAAGPSKELVAIRVLLELLESKGILTREEYVAALRRAAKGD